MLSGGRQEHARIRVEGIIRDQLMLQAFEILELYVELISVRAQLMSKTKEIPRDMCEALSSVVYAAQRVSDLPELLKLRKMFEAKYGKVYIQEATNDATANEKWQVNGNLIRCLLIEPPAAEEKLATLSDIAQKYGVEWDISAAARELLPPAAAAAAGHAPPPPVPAANGLDFALGDDRQPSHTSVYSAASSAPAMQAPMHPAAPLYADANQAAAAAAHMAAQAQTAADFAAKFAMTQAGFAQQQYQQQQAPYQQPPPPLPHPGAQQQWQAPPPIDPAAVAGSSSNGGGHHPAAQPYPGPADAAPPHGPPAVGQPYVPRSNSDIQRAYDAAQGPPAKDHQEPATAPPPPPAQFSQFAPPPVPAPLEQLSPMPSEGGMPPAPPQNLPTAPAAPAAGPDGLPAPPRSGVQPGAPAAAKPIDEVEDLARRLEALKKS